jgi:hypothetical protein
MRRILTICNFAIAMQIFIACLVIPGLTTQTSAATSMQALESQPLYRFRSKKSYLLYTTSAELPKLSNGHWTNEGIVCHVPIRPNHTINTKPVYQLVKSDNWGVRYAYTSSFGEADKYKGGLADKYGIGQWMNQGEMFRVCSDQAMNTVPLFRLYLPVKLTNPGQEFTGVVPGTDAHLLTTNESEKSNAISRGWVDQGIIGYVWMSPYPPAAPMLPDLMVAKTEAEEFSVRAFISNRGKANTKGIKFDVKLFVYDDKGKFLYQLEESNENNNETAMLDGPRRKIDLSKVDSERVIPPAIEMTGKQESGGKDRVLTTYVFSVFNWNDYPADWFQSLKSLDATSCDGKPTDARMLAHIWIEVNGNPPRKAGCKVLNSQQDFKTVQTFATGGAIPKPDKVFVVLEDRLAGKRYQSNSYSVEVFGIDKELVTVGCKRLLGRASSFVCTKKLGFESCENLRKQGKPIECRLAGSQQ